MSLWSRHQVRNELILLVIGVLVVIAIGGLVEITPLFFIKHHREGGRYPAAHFT